MNVERGLRRLGWVLLGVAAVGVLFYPPSDAVTGHDPCLLLSRFPAAGDSLGVEDLGVTCQDGMITKGNLRRQ